MILPFSTQLNGKPTEFVGKIWSGFIENKLVPFYHDILNNFNLEIVDVIGRKPKLHTIRKDEKNRWKPGVLIDFFINVRKKDMFRFAPRLPVVSIQTIKIFHLPKSDNINVYVDERRLKEDEIAILAINDGFESVDDFKTYFNEDFIGKLIHWTNLKY